MKLEITFFMLFYNILSKHSRELQYDQQYNVTVADLEHLDLIKAADYALESFQVV